MQKEVIYSSCKLLAGKIGIEPMMSVLKTEVLPLNYSPLKLIILLLL